MSDQSVELYGLRPDDDPALAALVHDLEEARAESYPLTAAGYLHQRPEDSDPRGMCDLIAADLGFLPLGAHWIEVPRRVAHKILLHIISEDLAYPTEVVGEEEAEDLAQRLLAAYPSGGRFFTNGAVSGAVALYDKDGNEVVGWRSLSEAPLDHGLIAIGPTRALIVWAEDAP
jgi:hypothetical protein